MTCRIYIRSENVSFRLLKQDGFSMPPKQTNAVVSYAAANTKTPVPYVLQTLVHPLIYGHVKLLLLRLSSPVCPNSSPLTFFGSFALAQHCIATLLISSISSLSSLNCLFASLLFLSLTPFPSFWAVMYCNPGVVKLRLPPINAVRSAAGDETRDSRLTHSAIRA